MQMLNRYFAPFALILIISDFIFGEPDPFEFKMSLGILVLSIIVNWWLSRNLYRFSGWTQRIRVLQVWLNYIWAVPLFWLSPLWGPMWLLFVMAPATAAVLMSKWQTLGISLVSALTMLAIYYDRGVFQSPAYGGMVIDHAVFIVIFSLFIHTLAQTALRLRDVNLGHSA
jgi:hypothetical protein